MNQNAEGLPRNEGNFYWSDKFASDRKHRKPLKNYGFVLMDMETKLRPSKAIFNSAKKALKACGEKSACPAAYLQSGIVLDESHTVGDGYCIWIL